MIGDRFEYRLARGACSLALAAAVAGAGLFGLAGCSEKKAQLAEGVAAQVEGIEILEDDVTAFVQGFLASVGATDEESLAAYLLETDYTSELLRNDGIGRYVEYAVLQLAAEERGVTIDASAIDARMFSMMSAYESEEAWEAYLQENGLTETMLADYVAADLVQSALVDTFAVESDPTEEELLAMAESYVAYLDGAKRVSQITFDAADKELAERVLADIEAGRMTFADAVAEHSTDDYAEAGGDLGWDAVSYDAQSYAEQLAGMSAGEVSGPIVHDDCIHIIMCTEVYEAPDVLESVSQLPDDFVDIVKQSIAAAAQQAAFDEWLAGFREGCDIAYASMPEGLPYYVDLSLHGDLAAQIEAEREAAAQSQGQIAEQ